MVSEYHSRTLMGRARRVHGPVKGNNRTGRAGKFKCSECQKIRSKVCSFPKPCNNRSVCTIQRMTRASSASNVIASVKRCGVHFGMRRSKLVMFQALCQLIPYPSSPIRMRQRSIYSIYDIHSHTTLNGRFVFAGGSCTLSVSLGVRTRFFACIQLFSTLWHNGYDVSGTRKNWPPCYPFPILRIYLSLPHISRVRHSIKLRQRDPLFRIILCHFIALNHLSMWLVVSL
jgi:hypothetical protein